MAPPCCFVWRKNRDRRGRSELAAAIRERERTLLRGCGAAGAELGRTTEMGIYLREVNGLITKAGAGRSGRERKGE